MKRIELVDWTCNGVEASKDVWFEPDEHSAAATVEFPEEVALLR